RSAPPLGLLGTRGMSLTRAPQPARRPTVSSGSAPTKRRCRRLSGSPSSSRTSPFRASAPRATLAGSLLYVRSTLVKRVLIHATFLLGSLLLGSFVFALGVQTFRWLWDTTPEGGLSTIIDHWPWLVRLPAVFLTSLGGAALVVVGSATRSEERRVGNGRRRRTRWH